MGITSKEITIIIIEIIIGGIIALVLPKINVNISSFKESILIISIAIITSGVVIYIFNKKLKEIGEELDAVKSEQKKLCEKLKIHGLLTDMKVDIKELQKEVFKR